MKPNNRLGTVSVGQLRYLLTARDQAVVRSIREWRFLTTRQIFSLFFAEHASYTSGIRACTRVLTRLKEHRLLYRLDRPVGGPGGGSASYVWGVDVAGDRLLRADPESGYTKRSRAFEPTPLFLAHTLAVADVRVRLAALQREQRLDLVEVQAEPASWRPFAWRGRSQILKPDLYVVTGHGDEEWHRYVEVDRATESLQVLVDKKARAYEDYLATGTDEAHLGVVPEVLWIVPDQQRADRFRAALFRAHGITKELHTIVCVSDLDAALAGSLHHEAHDERGHEEPNR
jgi:hypothetical protein